MTPAESPAAGPETPGGPTPITEPPDGPADLSFAAVNDYVHGSPEYEHLQWLCLTLAGALERAQEAQPAPPAPAADPGDDAELRRLAEDYRANPDSAGARFTLEANLPPARVLALLASRDALAARVREAEAELKTYHDAEAKDCRCPGGPVNPFTYSDGYVLCLGCHRKVLAPPGAAGPTGDRP